MICTPEAAAIDPRFSLVSTVLTEEENKIPKAELLLPPDQIGYSAAGAGAGVVEITDGAELLFTGRIRQQKDNFWNERSVICEGALGYLEDLPDLTTVASEDSPVTVQAAFAALLADYAAKADAGRKIYAGTCDVVGSITKTAGGQAWDTINGWVNDFGGYLTLRRYNEALYLDYKKDRPGLDSSQVIRFGENMQERLDRMTDAAKIETGVLAIGGTPEGASGPVTLNGYTGTENGVLFASTRAVYGSIYKRVEFKEALTQADLYAAAQAYLAGAAAAAVSLKLSAVDNKLLGLAPYHMKVGYSYQVVSAPHGLNAAFPLKKRVLNLIAPENSSTEFGAAETALTEKQASWSRNAGKIAVKAETALQTASTALTKANAAATPAQVQAAISASEGRVADYVESRGTDTSVTGITWKWEKWHSGKAVCEGVATLSVASGGLTQAGSTYYKEGNIAFPSSLFTEAPDLFPAIKSGSVAGNKLAWAGNLTTTTKTTAYYTVFRHVNTSAAVDFKINLYAVGKWK